MARFKPSRLFRRLSSRDSHSNDTTTSHSPSPTSELTSPKLPIYSVPPSAPRKSASLPKLRKKYVAQGTEIPEAVQEQRESVVVLSEDTAEEEPLSRRSGSETLAGERSRERTVVDTGDKKTPAVSTEELKLDDFEELQRQPTLVVQEPTPDVVDDVRGGVLKGNVYIPQEPTYEEPTPSEGEDTPKEELSDPAPTTTRSNRSISPGTTEEPTQRIRKQSLVNSANAKIVKTLIQLPDRDRDLPTTDSSALPTSGGIDLLSPSLPNMTAMLHRKIWVKRPGASATLVQIREADLVDDVRDMILRKYANSLGKTFDAPDMTLQIVTREDHGRPRTERTLGPEEEMCRTIDTYYPGGQTVEDALIINVPQRRTPKPSPRIFHNPSYHTMDDYRPLENGTDYFPQMPTVIPTTIPQTTGSHDSRSSHQHHSVAAPAEHPRSISVLNTGQIPPLPSPGGQSRRHQHRPKFPRQPTSSPTILSHPTTGAITIAPGAVNSQQHLVHRASTRPRVESSASEAHRPNGLPAPPSLPTPPAPEAPPTNKNSSTPPTPSSGVPTHLPKTQRPRKGRKSTPPRPSAKSRYQKEGASAPGLANSVLDGSVPPINVLIVEDNIINLRILEGLMKRLKVRWQTAMNGQIAVDKWKAGGFHLVLMDIQMPVMSGLQATKEIRRLERVNSIGVFSSSTPTSPVERSNGDTNGDMNGDETETEAAHQKSKEDDKLQVSEGLFKSPVIIVALTASSLQSDRHEALAAGCNDFLTKPVTLVWLERKVKEWGCMQALIDFDGWRKWKDYAAQQEAGKSEAERQKEREKEERDRVKAEKLAKLQEKQAQRVAKEKEEKERKKRVSMSGTSEAGSTAGAGGEADGPSPSTDQDTLSPLVSDGTG